MEKNFRLQGCNTQFRSLPWLGSPGSGDPDRGDPVQEIWCQEGLSARVPSVKSFTRQSPTEMSRNQYTASSQ